MNTNSKGARSEGAVLAALLKAGYSVLVPFGTLRYDLAVDIPGEGIKRIQCKTGRLTGDRSAVLFNAASVRPTGQRDDYRGSADYFGVYCHEIGECYLVPVDHVGINEARLRLVPSKNNQRQGTRVAADYLIARL